MSSRYYFNPYNITSTIQELTDDQTNVKGYEKTVSYLHKLKRPFEDFLDKEEVYKFLELLLKTPYCFGKFDLFNKWRINSIKISDADIASQLKSRVRHVMLKPATHCVRCKYIDKCSVIRISLDELAIVWDNLYFSKGSIFGPEEGKS